MHPYDGFNFLVIRVKHPINDNLTNSIYSLWRKYLPNDPFILNPLNSYVIEVYQNEYNLGHLLTWFTVIGLLIATMGLFGLVGLIISQQLKQLGIRKILGASSFHLLFHTVSNFSLLVIIANILAFIPVWIFMDEWLANFSTHITMSVWLFPITIIFCLLLAWVAILWQVVQVKRISLINVVKYE
ncbi:MAG TPA: hypothetical protein PLC47_04480, partial [Bacteroidales bacterium]|nr:hypothetical protein [Bacteroidales bacterium]